MDMNEQEVSNCISGLGRLGAEWSNLTPKIRKSLGDAFLLTIGVGGLPPRGLAMTVHGLGRMNADFATLPPNFRSSIMSAIHKISPKVNSLEISNVLYGMGKMGTSFSVDESPLDDESIAATTNSNATPFLIPGLAMNGVSSDELDISIAGRSSRKGVKSGAESSIGMSRKARDSLLEALGRESWQLNAQGIANSLWGLMLMDAQWWVLSPILQGKLLEIVKREANRMSEQELCNTIYALGRLGVKWLNVPSETRYSVLNAIEDSSSVIAPEGVVMTLLGLGRMQLTWSDMTYTLVSALSSSVERVVQSSSERTLSGLIHALATIGAQWGDLSSEVQSALIDGIANGDARNREEKKANDLIASKKEIANAYDMMPAQKSGRSPERASRAAFGASAILTIKTIRNLSAAPVAHKTSPPSSSSTSASWVQSNPKKSQSNSLSTTSLLNQKSSRAAAALLLSPSSPLCPTSLVAIQTMISPPNLNMHSFQALIRSQLASPVVESNPVSSVQPPKRLPSQPVAANELEFYKSVAATPKATVPTSSKVKISLNSINGKSKPELSKVEKKMKQKEIYERRSRESVSSVEMGIQRISDPLQSVTTKTASSANEDVAGNHLVYSLGQIGVSWDQLGTATRLTLSDSLVSSLPLMGEMGVVNSLHGLTTLGAKWKELRNDVTDALQLAIERVSTEMGEQGVSVTILSLAKLDVVWTDDLTEPCKNALKRATARQAHIGEHALSSLLYGLGKLSRPWSGLAHDVRQTLKQAIVVCHLNDNITPQGVSNSLHGLAQMQATWSVLSSSVRLALFAEVTKAVPLATETQLSNILGSLGKMGLQWESLPDRLKARVVTALAAKTKTFSEWHLSTLLFSLGSMGLGWKSLPSSLKTDFVDALLRVNKIRNQLTNPDMSDEECSAADIAVEVEDGEGWRPKVVGLADYDELLTVVEYIIRKDSSGQNKQQKRKSGDRVEAAVDRKKALQMNAQGVSMTIVGMSRLAASYGLLPDSLIRSISKSLQNASPYMNCAQVAASVSGMSKAQWRWDALSMELKEELQAAITRTAPKATSLDMAILINGMGTMGARWATLPGDARTSLQVGIKRTAMTGVADEVAGVTFGLALMEVSWTGLPIDVKQILKEGILRVCGAESINKTESERLSQSFTVPDTAVSSENTGTPNSAQTSTEYSHESSPTRNIPKEEEEELELSWLMAPSDNRYKATRGYSHPEKKLIKAISPQALANLMYGISLLIFEEKADVHEELTPVHIALLDILSLIGVVGSHFTEAEKEQILIYLSTLQTLTPLDHSITERPRYLLRADKPLTKPSKLQQSVVSSLTTSLRKKNEKFEVEDEYSAFNGAFPIDATIFEGDKPVAFVEVNGPQHYRQDGRLRRKDLMKEALYRSKYPDASYTRVRFDQVNRLGSCYVGAQVAQFISNSPPIRVRCKPPGGDGASFFPLFSRPNWTDCAVVYQNCEEDGLSTRRAERQLAKALSLDVNDETASLSPIINHLNSLAFYWD